MIHDLTRPPTDEELAEILDSSDYRRWKITEYEHWALYLNPSDQTLLGRSYAWLSKRHVDRMSMSELMSDELGELVYAVLRDYEQAVKRCWPGVTTVNAEWLGNTTTHHRGHGHLHLIPRYRGKVDFAGVKFIDPDHEKRRTSARIEVSDDVLEQIRFSLKSALGR
ncbi:MAG: hypothetical protein AAB582_00215 [Patescibacteria group bacterium]